MSDIGLAWNSDAGAADFQFAHDDFVTDEGLQTAVILSLFLDRRAEPGDELPEGPADLRGWWADEFANVDDDKIGSRLWLLERPKNTADVPSRAESYAREALQWLVDDKVASAIAASSDFLRNAAGVPVGYSLTVAISRPRQTDASFRFDRVWAGQAARSA